MQVGTELLFGRPARVDHRAMGKTDEGIHELETAVRLFYPNDPREQADFLRAYLQKIRTMQVPMENQGKNSPAAPPGEKPVTH